MKKTRKLQLGIGLILIMIALTVFYISQKNHQPTDVNEKTISIKVYLSDETVQEYTINTQEEFLRGALEQEDLISGEEGPYGLYVTEVAGDVADFNANGSFWSFSKNDVLLETGVDQTPIVDGDQFEVKYTIFE